MWNGSKSVMRSWGGGEREREREVASEETKKQSQLSLTHTHALTSSVWSAISIGWLGFSLMYKYLRAEKRPQYPQHKDDNVRTHHLSPFILPST